MNNEKKQGEIPVYPTYQYYPAYQQEDEINLVDAWRALVRQKKIIFKVAIACLMLGCAIALIKPTKYGISAVVQIGSLTTENGGEVGRVPIESVQDVLNKIKSAYIPFVLAQDNQQNTGDERRYEIEANSPKDTNIIQLEMKCRPIDEQKCKSLIDGVLKKTIADHSLIIGMSRKNLEVRIASAENGLKSSKDVVRFITYKKQRLDKTSDLLSNQLKEKKVLLDRALKNRDKITTSNAANAMSVLLVDNEIQRTQELIDGLEKRLIIDLNQERDDLEKAEQDNTRLQNEQENAIDQLKSQLLSKSNTKAVVPVLVSDRPVGISPLLIVLISAFLGLFVGMFAAFFCEFVGKAKAHTNSKAV